MRRIVLDGTESVGRLADRMGERRSRIVGVAFRRLGRMLTIADRLDRQETEALAREFGVRVVWKG